MSVFPPEVRRGPGVQVFLYPEELESTEPRALAEQVLGLGIDAVSIALTYHRARRVFPRHNRVSFSPGGAVSFSPNRGLYGRLVPETTASPRLCEAVDAFREACRSVDLRFRVWLVALHNESMALAHPALAARWVDGSSTGFSLCPSTDEAIEYVAALIDDVCSRLGPEAVDLEAALYPAWDPGYSLTLALDPLSELAQLYGAQCFCDACLRLPGLGSLEERARRAAGPPFGPPRVGADVDDTIGDAVALARAEGVRRLLTVAAGAARRRGSELSPTVSGSAASARLRGLSPGSVAPADRIVLGLGSLSGQELERRLMELSPLVGDRVVTASLNWAPGRTPEKLVEDVERVVAGGAGGLSLYNLSLVPEVGLEAFRAAAGSFRGASAA